MSKKTPAIQSRRNFVAGSAALFSTVGFVPASVKAAQFEFKCGTPTPVDHPASIRLKQMWGAVERESNGRIRTQFFPSNQLGGDAAQFSQVRLGSLPFFLIGSNLASVVPSADISLLGFVYKDADEGFRCMDGPLGSYVRDEVNGKGLYAFRTMWDGAMIQVAGATRSVRAPDDLRAFKVRVTESKITVDLFKSLGAIPVALSGSEAYTALQTRLVDGAASTLISLEGFRTYEVTRYISLTNHNWSGYTLIANGDVWKSLPADLQAIVERNNTKYATIQRRDTKALNVSLVDKLGRQGNTINAVDQAPFRARLRPYYESWAKTFGPTQWGLLESALGRKLA
jgi:TRAP-type transport system periplasmic protein